MTTFCDGTVFCNLGLGIILEAGVLSHSCSSFLFNHLLDFELITSYSLFLPIEVDFWMESIRLI